MAAADTVERVAIAVTPELEELAGLALRDIEMGPIGQPPGYRGHNLPSVMPLVRTRGQEVRLSCRHKKPVGLAHFRGLGASGERA